MTPRDGMRALRESVAVSAMPHVRHVRVRGGDAYAALDRVVTSELRLRDGQMLHSLMLNESGTVFADIILGSDDEEFFILAEGPSAAELTEYLRDRFAAFPGVEVEDRTAGSALVTLNGPYAWELLALLAGPDVVGLPYLTFFHFDQGLCFRMGKTGEYGYGIMVARGEEDNVWASLLERGAGLEVGVADLAILDQCALENWYFNARREGREPLTPIELQLQWRVSYRKSYAGSEALALRRQTGARGRVTCLVSDQPVEAGAPVTLRGAAVGRVLQAGHSSTRSDWAALALIDLAWAHPGIDGFRVGPVGLGIPARSETPPLLMNRSLFISPQIHSYATRHEFQFPPIVRGQP